jgi:hypothetical protein
VRMSVLGLANISRVSVEECREALRLFQEPDLESSSPEHEGRKIRVLDGGGWLVLNGERYSKLLSYEERKEYNRQKQAEYRRRRKEVKHEGGCAGAQQAIVDGLAASRPYGPG